MGIDCIGCIEVFADDCWSWAIRTSAILRGDTEIMESLFLSENGAGFDAPFSQRGLPRDVSADFEAMAAEMKAMDVEIVDAGWASHAEMRAIAWDESAGRPDQRIHKFEVLEDGKERYVGKALRFAEAPLSEDDFGSSDSVRLGRFVYKKIVLKRSHLVARGDFRVLFDIGEMLACKYGGENVRWAVVFVR